MLGTITAGCGLIASRVRACGVAEEHPLARPLRMVQQSLAEVKKRPGYECQFEKYEIVDNSVIQQKLKVKLRHEPFSVYLRFEEPRAGREVIYVNGRNNNSLLIHEPGVLSLIGTLRRAPDHPDVRRENRYPITQLGLARLVENLIRQWKLESNYGETEVKYYRDAKMGKTTCNVIESSHPQPRRQFPFKLTRVWIAPKSKIVVRIQQYAFPQNASNPPPLVEDYQYSAIRWTSELADLDFDVDNPTYNF